MNTERNDSQRERLLRDVFAEDFEASPEEVKGLMGEFRMAYWRRRAARIVMAAAALVAVVVFAPFYLRMTGSKPTPVISSAVTVNTVAKVKTISDEELLGLFPPDSCFLAELDGKQVLVFRDEKLSEEFLE